MSATLDLHLDEHGSPVFVFDMPGWRFERRYIMHKTLRSAGLRSVVEHAFLVEKLPALAEYGATYEVWVIELDSTDKPRVVRHHFGDETTLNNWTFAHRLFVKLFGCGFDLEEEVPSYLYETTVFGPVGLTA